MIPIVKIPNFLLTQEIDKTYKEVVGGTILSNLNFLLYKPCYVFKIFITALYFFNPK